MDNEELIDRIRSGDKTVLKELYLLHREPFFAYFHKQFKLSKAQVKDLYQICIIVFYDNIVNGRVRQINSEIHTYLLGIGKNKALESIRRKNNKIVYLENHFLEISMDETDIEDKLQLEEDIQKVNQALLKLGNPCRSVIEQFYYHQRNLSEISRELDYKNPETVKNIKYKCIKRLRAVYRKMFGEENLDMKP